MPIRPATFADLLPAAHVCSKAFFDEDLFGKYMHPARASYPGDVYLFFLRSLRVDFFDARNVVMVSHVKDQASRITGVAVWVRKGAGGDSMAASQSWLMWFTGRFGIPVYNWLGSLVWPDRAADPSRCDALERGAPFTEHYWKTPERLENWYLGLLGTGPEYQGQGYGKELLKWGIDKAREQGICVSLISAAGKEGFYKYHGVTEEVGMASEGGDENPLRLVDGGMILFSKGIPKAIE
jgi:GNAT superfamily N-acetyltransferase